MTPTRGEPGLRALHLAQAIIHCTKFMWPNPDVGSPSNVVKLYEHWGAEVVRLCAEHFAEADRVIEQLVRNAAEMARTDLTATQKREAQHRFATIEDYAAAGLLTGLPASVPGERG